MLEFIKNHVELIISGVFLVAYIVTLVIWVLRIQAVKKSIPAECESQEIKPSAKYISSLVLGAVLIFLPCLVKFKWFYCLAFCGTGLAAAVVVFKERLEMLIKIRTENIEKQL